MQKRENRKTEVFLKYKICHGMIISKIPLCVFGLKLKLAPQLCGHLKKEALLYLEPQTVMSGCTHFHITMVT